MGRPKTSLMKEKIISAVEDLISTRGVNSFSLQDIADELYISKGTLYYHYKTKDEILLAIMDRHIAELEDEYEDWLVRHKDDVISKERFLNVIFYKGVKLFNRAKIHIYIINECVRDNDELKKTYNNLWKTWQSKLQEGVAQVFKDEEDKEALSYMLMLIIDGLTVREVLEDNSDLDDRLVKLIEKGTK